MSQIKLRMSQVPASVEQRDDSTIGAIRIGAIREDPIVNKQRRELLTALTAAAGSALLPGTFAAAEQTPAANRPAISDDRQPRFRPPHSRHSDDRREEESQRSYRGALPFQVSGIQHQHPIVRDYRVTQDRNGLGLTSCPAQAGRW